MLGALEPAAGDEAIALEIDVVEGEVGGDASGGTDVAGLAVELEGALAEGEGAVEIV
jgi:hypothetical protein